MSVVYFIRSGDAGAIKVGTTTNLSARLIALDCGPEPLSVIGTIPGGPVLERAIHQALRPWRRRLEWFRPTPEVLSFVERALKEPDAIPGMVATCIERQAAHAAAVTKDSLSAFRAACWAVDIVCRREGLRVVADVAGVTDEQVSKYRRGGAKMGVVAFLRLQNRWPDDFALVELILGLPHLKPEEVRANRATLENARDAIDAQLAKLRPAA